MRVILTTGRVGQGYVQRAGDVIEVDERDAKALIASGQAELETAMDEPKREKAVARSNRGR